MQLKKTEFSVSVPLLNGDFALRFSSDFEKSKHTVW